MTHGPKVAFFLRQGNTNLRLVARRTRSDKEKSNMSLTKKILVEPFGRWIVLAALAGTTALACSDSTPASPPGSGGSGGTASTTSTGTDTTATGTTTVATV